jgi:hypothetical protein
MPWTAPDTPGAKEKIAAKEALLIGVVELNPYVEVVGRDPLQLQLTQCNVFFRHALGAYVDHTRHWTNGEFSTFVQSRMML